MATIFTWSEHDVQNFLIRLSMPERWLPLLKEANGLCLCELTDEDLKEIGCTEVIHRKKLLGHIKDEKRKAESVLSSPAASSSTLPAASSPASSPVSPVDDAATPLGAAPAPDASPSSAHAEPTIPSPSPEPSISFEWRNSKSAKKKPKWIAYDPESQAVLVDKFLNGPRQFRLTIQSTPYHIDLDNWRQTNEASGFHREIRKKEGKQTPQFPPCLKRASTAPSMQAVKKPRSPSACDGAPAASGQSSTQRQDAGSSEMPPRINVQSHACSSDSVPDWKSRTTTMKRVPAPKRASRITGRFCRSVLRSHSRRSPSIIRIELPPKDIRFTHDRISSCFRNRTHVDTTIESIVEGTFDPHDFRPAMLVTKKDDKWYTFSNRRLFVLRVAQNLGVERAQAVPVRTVDFNNWRAQRQRDGRTKWERSFSSQNDGISVRVRSKYRRSQ